MAATLKISQDDINDWAIASQTAKSVDMPDGVTIVKAGLQVANSALTGIGMLANEQVRSFIQFSEDYDAWLLEQAAALRERRYLSLDVEHLAEELEDMAARDRREIKKHLKKLLLHLLKFNAQSEELARHHSWRTSVREAREDIADLLEDSPGIFKGQRDEFVTTAYGRARVDAADETGIPLASFPKDCPWSFDDIMRDDFYPGVTRKD